MDTRYPPTQAELKEMDTQELRDNLLVESVFVPEDVTVVYSMIDRVVVLGAMPVQQTLNIQKNIDPWKNFGVDYFLERRELGMINIGGPGVVTCDGVEYNIANTEALYVGKETKEVLFSAVDPANPPKFYMMSAPAHEKYPTKYISYDMAIKRDLGSPETANERTINQFIHPDLVQTCQVMMGLTILKSGSVWNTMPAHTHERRMEVYIYFNVDPDQAVFHFLGEPQETRHILMHNEQAVFSPAYSIHSGCGTKNYNFIWAMAGENQEFDDMDEVPTQSLL